MTLRAKPGRGPGPHGQARLQRLQLVIKAAISHYCTFHIGVPKKRNVTVRLPQRPEVFLVAVE